MALRLVQRHELRLSQRLEQRIELRAPTPPDAVSGIEGLMVADQVLKEQSAIGMLVGGLAKELWRGVTNDEKLSEHKDVDVLVLSQDCASHPEQWASGVDWWVCHNHYERPTNGNPVGLLWRVQLESHALHIPRGLYLCPLQLLRQSIAVERSILKGHRITGGHFRISPAPLYPILDEMQLRWSWASLQHPVAEYCR